MKLTQTISVVIPCYKSEQSIEDIISRIVKTIEAEKKYKYEIICVDDCSPDNTYEVLRNLALKNPFIKVVTLTRNYGQHSALMAGFHFVKGDIVVCLDDDGETPPERIPKLINKLNEGYDLVSAHYPSDERPLIRELGTRASLFMAHTLIGMPNNIELNSFFACKYFLIPEVLKYAGPYPFVLGLMLRITRNIANVDIERENRISGTSGYSFRGLINLWLNGFTSFSVKPLRIASITGALFAVVGFFIAFITILNKFINPNTVVGFSSIFASILLFSGVQLISLGLVGEYVGRAYLCINNAPQFTVRETINCNNDSKKDA